MLHQKSLLINLLIKFLPVIHHNQQLICLIDSSVFNKTQGSDLANFFIASTNLGKSEAFLTSTATLKTVDTEYFMDLITWAFS